MKALIQVYNEIDSENIEIFDYKIPFKCPAITIEVGGNYGIFVDHEQIEDVEEEFIVMPHECGHCKTGTTHPVGVDTTLIRKHEYKANRWSVLTFLPIEKLYEAFSMGYTTPFEISEYLDLPERFVVMAFEHYRAMGKI